MTEQYLTPAEVANILQIPSKTLEHWRSIEEGPAYIKMGRHVRYRRSDVDSWAEANLIETY